MKNILFGMAFLTQQFIYAQNETDWQQKKNTDERIEALTDRTGSENDYSELTDDLHYFIQNPININEMNDDKLACLTFISDIHRRNLYNYILRYGDILSCYELLAIDGFDRPCIEKLLPYIEIRPLVQEEKLKIRNVLKYGQSKLLFRYQKVLQQQQGYENKDDNPAEGNSYQGDPSYCLLKYSFNYHNRIRYGFTAEKDAGEEFFTGSNKAGFDFYSAHYFYSSKGILKSMAAGDYHAQFGQGLTLWSGMTFGKSPEAMLIKHANQGIRPYTSCNENSFFRGAAFTLKFKPFTVSSFFSSKKYDANICGNITKDSSETWISSIQETGYHRTAGEISDENAIRMTVAGGNIAVKGKIFRTGVTGTCVFSNAYLQPQEQLYRLYSFEGKMLGNAGIDFDILWKSFNFFGEVAVNTEKGLAMNCGMTMAPDPRLTLSMIYRNYGERYFSFFGNPFGEGSFGSGEEGIYTGVNMLLSRKITLSAYADIFRFRWLRFRRDAPSEGYETYLKLSFIPARYCELYGSYRFEKGSANEENGGPGMMNHLEETNRHRFRINNTWNIMDYLEVGNRIECAINGAGGMETRYGYLVIQDAAFAFPGRPVRLSVRYALFDTDSYDERIYAYEPGVLYSFSIPACYYKGSRLSMVLSWEMMKKIRCWARYSRTCYSNRNVIGSGPEQIDGNVRSEICVQMQLKF